MGHNLYIMIIYYWSYQSRDLDELGPNSQKFGHGTLPSNHYAGSDDVRSHQN